MEDSARRPSYRNSSESLFTPIDPFKPSVAYGVKKLITPIHENRPQVNRPPSWLLQPPYDFAIQTTNSTPTRLLHHAVARPLPQRIHSPLIPRDVTDQSTSSPTPFRISPVESTSFGVSNDPQALALIREDGTDVDTWEDEYRGPEIMPQHSASETPTPHGQRTISVASSYSTHARVNTSRIATETPQYTTTKSEKDTQHPPYALRKPEKEPTIENHGPSTHRPPSCQEEITLSTYLLAFIFDTLPRQIYLHLLLRLPYLYFSRVTRIFQDAEMSLPEIKKMALEVSTSNDPATFRNLDALIMNSSPRYVNLQRSWGLFIDSLLREWKTLNIISVLLLSAILSILQIQSAADDPVTRYTSLLSMICALMSLLYGCVFIIRFGTMRTTYKAAEWAQEAQQSKTSIFWNVWVLLAMPTIWLAWSIIMFCVCIMSFVWRTGTTDDVNKAPLTPHDARTPRIVITVVFVLGIVYFVLIASTLRRYGEAMDRAWQSRIMSWVHEKVHRVEDTLRHHSRTHTPSENRSPGCVRNQRVVSSRHSKDTLESETPFSSLGIDISVMPPSRPASPSSPASSRQPYSSIEEPDSSPKPVQLKSALLSSLHKLQIPHIMSTDDETSSTTSTDYAAGGDRHTEENFQIAPQINVTKLFNVSPEPASIILPLADEVLASSLWGKEDYEKLALDVHSESNWNDDHTTKTLNVDRVKDVVQRWNNTFFLERGGQIQLCEELFILDDLPDIDSVIDNISQKNAGTDTDGGGHMVLPRPSRHAIFHFLWKDELPHNSGRYKSRSWSEGLGQVDILYHLSSVPSATSAVDSEDSLTPGQNRISLFRNPDIRPPIAGF